MLKNIKSTIVLGSALALLTSCSVTYVGSTNNSVGSKKATAGGSIMNPNLDYTFKAAAIKGKIDKIGLYEFKSIAYGPFIKVHTTITGE